MKQCARCKEVKDFSNFWKDNRYKDGYGSWCKQCNKERGTAYRREKRNTNPEWREKDNAAARKYKQSDKWKARKIAWYYSENGRKSRQQYLNTEQFKSRIKQYNENNKEKLRAYWSVKQAIKAGKLASITTQICQDCGNPADHYHHRSYEKEHRLNVIPLCVKCHSLRHINQS